MADMMVNYTFECARNGHIDPNFNNLAYGSSNKRGKAIENNLNSGSILFFNTTIHDRKYITAYFYVDRLLIKGRDDIIIANLGCDASSDEVVVLGRRELSKILTCPLEIEENLLVSLTSFNITEDYFNNKRSRLEAIKDKTFNHMVISADDTNKLLKLCENRG